MLYRTATFGGFSTTGASSTGNGYLASLQDASLLAATPANAGANLHLYPNPAAGSATLSGAPASAAVVIFDALGRRVATATADATGTAMLPGGLAPGLYLVRVGAALVRWAAAQIG